MKASSSNSSSGISASSRFSLAISARWESAELETETYSPSAMEMAPPTSAAAPAVRIGPTAVVAPATPTTTAAVETMPSFAPSTPARNQFRRWAVSVESCGSPPCWTASGGSVMGQAKHPHAPPASPASLT